MTEDLDRMFKAAVRELAFRERAYPGWIKSKRTTEEKAREELQNMRDIVDHFRRLISEREQS
jgi:hypothetical protein